jgi:hypothetical protein
LQGKMMPGRCPISHWRTPLRGATNGGYCDALTAVVRQLIHDFASEALGSGLEQGSRYDTIFAKEAMRNNGR